jgi:hypothetical protein
MATSAVFAKEFYHQRLFLKGWDIEKLPDGGLKYSTISFFEFWSEKNIQANVDNQGKVDFVTYSFFERLKRVFPFSQDQNLIAAHRRLKELEVQVQNPLSPDLHLLKREIHATGQAGAKTLENNLNSLNKEFEKANERSLLTTALVKVANFISAFFHSKPIEFYHFNPINLGLYKAMAISPALELTEQDPSRCQYSPIIQNNSTFPLPPELSRMNLQKLELGLLTEIRFTIDRKKFCLEYDIGSQEFIFDYSDNEIDPSPGLNLDSRESFTWSSPVLNLIEKKANGSTTVYPLQRSIRYTYQANWALHEKWTCAVEGGSLAMKMNSEYTIPLSQGNFCLKLFRTI